MQQSYPIREDLAFVRGDTFVFSVRVNQDGHPIMLDENGQIYFIIQQPDKTVVVKKIYGMADQGEDGYVTITLYPSDTERLSPKGNYQYEVEYRLSASAVMTALKGRVIVTEDIITPDVRSDNSG